MRWASVAAMGCLTALAMAGSASATEFIETFTGTVTAVSTSSSIAVGDAFTLSYVYDADPPSAPGGILIIAGTETDRFLNVSAQIDGVTYELPHGNASGLIENFVPSYLPGGEAAAQGTVHDSSFFVELFNLSATPYVDQPFMATGASGDGSICSVIGLSQECIDIAPTTVTLGTTTEVFSDIPEPSAWAIMLVGFGLVGARLRRLRPVRPVVH